MMIPTLKMINDEPVEQDEVTAALDELKERIAEEKRKQEEEDEARRVAEEEER